jgi:hypothetical protein
MSLVDGPLGPEEPELGCDDCFAELAGQDPDVQLPGLGAHLAGCLLAGCLACREEHESLRALLAAEGD